MPLGLTAKKSDKWKSWKSDSEMIIVGRGNECIEMLMKSGDDKSETGDQLIKNDKKKRDD